MCGRARRLAVARGTAVRTKGRSTLLPKPNGASMHPSRSRAGTFRGPVLGRQRSLRRSRAQSVRATRERTTSASTVDPAEVAKFGQLASRWWQPDGPMAGLHHMQPVRMAYIKHALLSQEQHRPRAADPSGTLAGLRVLDVGCGAGLLTEPLSRLGANTVGVDATGPNIEAARWHASLDPSLQRIEYHHCTVDVLAAQPQHAESYDAVCAMEIVEHLAPGTMADFYADCAACLKPGGTLITSTINRTAKSYALAIVAAEHVLRWVEQGTHAWDKFVTVEECANALTAAGLRPRTGGGVEGGPAIDISSVGGGFAATGMVYDPMSGEWTLGDDTGVNYLMCASKPYK